MLWLTRPKRVWSCQVSLYCTKLMTSVVEVDSAGNIVTGNQEHDKNLYPPGEAQETSHGSH